MASRRGDARPGGKRVELAPGTAVLPRGAEGVQIGADPDHHLVLTGLTAPQRAWLLRAARAAVPPQPGATNSAILEQ
ncbi:hypothetical protein ACFQ23_13805, partial [Schaalia naturae]